MKSNKVIIALLGISVAINIVTVFFGSDEPSSGISDINSDSRNFDQVLIDANNSLFSPELTNEALSVDKQHDDPLVVLRKKITILMKQNQLFQKQVDATNLKQANILSSLNTIVDKIDNQLLMPVIASQSTPQSSYNLDFNSISRDVVKRCMKLTSDTSSNIRQQQRQSRQQLLEDEAVDGNWSSEIESTVQSMLSDRQLQDSQLVSLNCRTTICQITVLHNSPAAKKLFETSFFSSFQQNVSQYDESFDQELNQLTGVFYLTRNSEN